jgi:hypothetical protein
MPSKKACTKELVLQTRRRGTRASRGVHAIAADAAAGLRLSPVRKQPRGKKRSPEKQQRWKAPSWPKEPRPSPPMRASRPIRSVAADGGVAVRPVIREQSLRTQMATAQCSGRRRATAMGS